MGRNFPCIRLCVFHWLHPATRTHFLQSLESMTSLPRATYRWQFHKGFTFNHARELVPYLHSLGVSHVYASPFFRASPGSTHGYDVCDHNELNPEVGTREEFDALVAELHRHQMGLIVDFVPNHMGISEPDNHWWMDVLENGPASPFAPFFDIEWHPLKRALENKVLLPILGDQYGKVLDSGAFKLKLEEGAFTVESPGARLPLAPRSTRPILHRATELLETPSDELLSIITALDHLPARVETDAGKMAERVREKRIVRERLKRLCETDSAVKDALGKAIADWQNADDPESLNRLDTLLSDQPYRLSYWRVAAEEINYRRFFDVNTLAAIRVELPEVFDATHVLLLELLSCGAVDGVRIDHIDGLAKPGLYLEQLRARMKECLGDRGPGWLLVEKILGPHEELRKSWPVDGTTGYEFGSEITNLLVKRSSERAMTQTYERFIEDRVDYKETVYQSKRMIMQVTMASEANVLGVLLSRLAESHRWYRDFTVNALTTAIREVIACFPVYRTYMDAGATPEPDDVTVTTQAIALARRKNPALEHSVFDFIRFILLPPAEETHKVDEELRQFFVQKFQQCTGPITAKGVEDTSFYVFNRLVALNEVGGHPGTFGAPADAFHHACKRRLASWPQAMLATSTHDTKRSEDVRMRLVALSEIPQEWQQSVRRWRNMNRSAKRVVEGSPAPDANEEYLIYQTILGSWPLTPMNDEERDVYIKRLQAYMTKALHEAKVNSSWIDPHTAWDQAVCDFIERILTPAKKNRFPDAMRPLAEVIARLGMVNSLAQTVLKLTVPGVPDFYQGTEMWDFSLVDPDNRRPVDYEARRTALSSLTDVEPASLMEQWRDGRIKLLVIQKLLELRNRMPALFAEGSYEPVGIDGDKSEQCLAFERSVNGTTLLVAVPKQTASQGFPPIGECWGQSTLLSARDGGKWRNIITGEVIENLSLAEVFRTIPVAALIAE